MSRVMRWWCVLLLSLAACHPLEVVRIVDGLPVAGRFVSDRAYEAYARGAELEARERPAEALRAYLNAASLDSEASEVWVRIGALRCRLGAEAAAAEAFAEAEERDAGYEPLWRERALCAERGGRLDDALVAARLAFAADPARVETALLFARLLDLTDNEAAAGRMLRSLSLRYPHRIEVWEAIVVHAGRTGEDRWRVEAAARVDALTGRANPARRLRGWEGVDAALRAGDIEAAHSAALRARVDMRRMAARAILQGRPKLATTEAALRLGADPSDTGARVALALGLELLGDGERARALIAEIEASPLPLVGPSRVLFAELLFRHVGSAPASLFLGAEVGSTNELRAALAESFEGRGEAAGTAP